MEEKLIILLVSSILINIGLILCIRFVVDKSNLYMETFAIAYDFFGRQYRRLEEDANIKKLNPIFYVEAARNGNDMVRQMKNVLAMYNKDVLWKK